MTKTLLNCRIFAAKKTSLRLCQPRLLKTFCTWIYALTLWLVVGTVLWYVPSQVKESMNPCSLGFNFTNTVRPNSYPFFSEVIFGLLKVSLEAGQLLPQLLHLKVNQNSNKIRFFNLYSFLIVTKIAKISYNLWRQGYFWYLLCIINTVSSSIDQIPLVPEDARIAPRTVATFLLAVRRL
jgi:hypothetical protein